MTSHIDPPCGQEPRALGRRPREAVGRESQPDHPLRHAARLLAAGAEAGGDVQHGARGLRVLRQRRDLLPVASE